MSITIEYLVIAGGGGASGSFGGGGGAGGYRSSVPGELSGGNTSPESILFLDTGQYVVTVGAGGAGGNAALANPSGVNGSNSSFSGITSLGGGTSGSYKNFTTFSFGVAGGSGGGGGSSETSTTYAGGAGTAGQGHAGGSGWGRNGYLGGGGGGAGSVGQDAVAGSKAGDGGAGITSAITGTAVARAGGGGGAAYNYQNGTVDGVGRNGGGNGRSNIDSAAGLPGIANTGGGGGGGGYISGVGGNGGSGVVIIRYLGPQYATGGTVISANGYTIHTFTSSGTFNYNGELVSGMSASVNSLLYGETFNITLVANEPNNTQVPYTITGVNSQDINGAALTGNFIVNNSVASLLFTATPIGAKQFSISAYGFIVNVTLIENTFGLAQISEDQPSLFTSQNLNITVNLADVGNLTNITIISSDNGSSYNLIVPASVLLEVRTIFTVDFASRTSFNTSNLELSFEPPQYWIGA